MRYKRTQKAWEINFSRVEEGYMYDYGSFITYAENRNKAKSQLLAESIHQNICLVETPNDEVTYLTIPVSRNKDLDKFEFEGEDLTLWDIEKKIRKNERRAELQSMLENTSISYCYIKKGGYYKPNSSGYTDFRHRAGVYTIEEGVEEAFGCDDISIIPIDIVEHNKMLSLEIESLKSRLLDE